MLYLIFMKKIPEDPLDSYRKFRPKMIATAFWITYFIIPGILILVFGLVLVAQWVNDSGSQAFQAIYLYIVLIEFGTIIQSYYFILPEF